MHMSSEAEDLVADREGFACKAALVMCASAHHLQELHDLQKQPSWQMAGQLQGLPSGRVLQRLHGPCTSVLQQLNAQACD